MKKVITTERLGGADVQALQAALTKLIGVARTASSPQRFDGSSTIQCEDEAGWNITGVALIEETLSDSSKVYNVQLLFGELSAPLRTQAAATERMVKRGNHSTKG